MADDDLPAVRHVGVVLLAAGGSSRMGRSKQLLRFRGRSLVRLATENALGLGTGPVIVVVALGATAVREELHGLSVEVVENPDWARGMGCSLRQGIQVLRHRLEPPRAALILLCDQPLVTAPDLARLLDCHGSAGKAITASEYPDGSLGVPAVFEARVFPEIEALPDEAGAKRVILVQPARVASVAMPTAALDWDTPEDFRSFAIDVDCSGG